MSDIRYKRVLLKLSGEALMGDGHYGIDPKVTDHLAKQVKDLLAVGHEVGVVVGGAFTAIVTALVNDIINPLISLIIGGLDFSGLNIGVFPIGDLIMSIINFLCISLVVFWMVKIINRFNRKKEKEPEPEAPAKPTTDELLADILAELKLQNGRAEAAKTLDAAEEEESSASER